LGVCGWAFLFRRAGSFFGADGGGHLVLSKVGDGASRKVPKAMGPFSISVYLLFMSARDILVDFCDIVNLRNRGSVLLKVL
jgi:hypothetical protein